MIRLWLALWLFLANPALAAPVQVTSGEHDGFTRLVLDYGTAVDWQMGRSADGYELRLADKTPSYDLRQAFDLIGKSRLAAIWVDPTSGALHVGLACACHAIPFEFRPGIVVIDLQDGPPPKGSAFELALNGAEAAPIAGPAPTRPRARPDRGKAESGYDWARLAYQELEPNGETAKGSEVHQPTILPSDPALQPLRDSLLHQMAQGAAQGVVDMHKPGTRSALPDTDFPLAQIRIGDQPANILAKDGTVKPDLTAKGAACVPADHLTMTDWGDATRPLVDQFWEAKANLTGEFDRPDPEAVTRAVRFQLFLGFGAEARQTLAAFAPNAPDAPVWIALSHLLDETADPNHLFRGMAACEGPAALWAVLDDPPPLRGDAIASGAVRLAFSDLPLHLRRQIGPRLADRFLALSDANTARAFQDAILRAPGQADGGVTLMEAKLDLHQGDAADAEEKAAAVLADPGPTTPEALIALTESRVAQNLPIAPEVAEALQALLAEHHGSALAPRLQTALVVAYAASGDFSAAFSTLSDSPQATDKVWELTATLAADQSFLEIAVLAGDTPPPHLDDTLRQTIARRLLGLGLAKPAQDWLEGVAEPDPILKAQIALGQADGHRALIALAGIESEEAQTLSLRALDLIGQDAPRAAMLAKAGNADAAALALARAGDWPGLATTEATQWADLATRLAPAAKNPSADGSLLSAGPLAQGHDLVRAGQETRAAVDALLASLPTPKSP